MAFEETGQADTFERKIEVWNSLTACMVDKLDFNPHDIIFDPNAGYRYRYGRAQRIRSCFYSGRGVDQEEICPEQSKWAVSAIVSFLSDEIIMWRDAMHAIFLYHAIGKGMDMGIVNASEAVSYDDIETWLPHIG
jgi:5-methyltetrahydrofolate--homocysteine methyltransferase